MIRLSKLMSEKGICSRREADKYIERGLVKVNGKIMSELGVKVDPSVTVELLSEALKERNSLITVMVHKPRDFVSSQPEDGYKSAIELITYENFHGEEKPYDFTTQGLAPLGRLDIDSTGLLLYSQDGVLAKKIIGENSDTEKEYLVNVSGQITDDKIKRLSSGLSLDGSLLKPAIVKKVGKSRLSFILKEGKKRQIRRMCDQVDLKVTRLQRMRIGNLKLSGLPEGKWKFIKSDYVV